MENGFIESLDGLLQDKCLNESVFILVDVRDKLES